MRADNGTLRMGLRVGSPTDISDLFSPSRGHLPTRCTPSFIYPYSPFFSPPLSLSFLFPLLVFFMDLPDTDGQVVLAKT